MDNQININEITDINRLKALAYDEVALLENHKRNLEMLNNRIRQVQMQENEVVTAEEPAEDLNTEEQING